MAAATVTIDIYIYIYYIYYIYTYYFDMYIYIYTVYIIGVNHVIHERCPIVSFHVWIRTFFQTSGLLISLRTSTKESHRLPTFTSETK